MNGYDTHSQPTDRPRPQAMHGPIRRLPRLAAILLLGTSLTMGWTAPTLAADTPDDADKRPQHRQWDDRAARWSERGRGEANTAGVNPELAPDDVEATDWPEGQPGPGDRPGAARFSSEQIEAALDVLDEVDPDVAQRMREFREQRPMMAAARLRPHLPELMRLANLRQTDPEHYALRIADMRLERETHELARRCHEAQQRQDPQADAMLEQLRQTVTAHFDVRQQLREKLLARLEARIQTLRQQIGERQEARQSLIDSRLEQLTGSTDEPTW